MNAQKMVLVDPSHKLPMPGSARLFSESGETVDLHDPFWRALVKDGSIEAAPVVSPPATPAATPAAVTSPAAAATPAAEAAADAAAAALTALGAALHQG